MHRPRIGIPTTLDDRGRWRAGRAYHYIDRRYADAIDGVGGMPLQLPIQKDVESIVDAIDGLLVPGGDDLPSEHALPEEAVLDLVPPEQLAFDRALVESAFRRGLPIFGICYGMQLLALAGGGALDAHLPTGRPEASEHRLPSSETHPIAIDEGSLLVRVIGAARCEVNSLHHQAVRSAGPRHRAVAHSPDGVIEAIERPSHPETAWEVGVQWHPEKLAGPVSERLFRAFVDACREEARPT